jgi:hypothetical protein
MHPNAKKGRRLRRAEASVYLFDMWGIKRTPGTLAKLASAGGGPVLEYDGRLPLPTPEALDDWARAQLSPPVASTSEHAVLKQKAQARAADAHQSDRVPA